THLDTPVQLPTERPEQVTVTDPAHPLYGRTFAVVALASTVSAYGQVTVVYRDDILLKIPVAATFLHPTSERSPSSKLSAYSVRELIRVAREIESPRKHGSGSSLNKDYLIISGICDLRHTVDADGQATTSELVTARHLCRKAMIYIRQSIPNQVVTNQESLRFQ
ncbi:MAG: hypothetical protein CBARDCOR_6784, partial [uncultured Caballeronia sp.]